MDQDAKAYIERVLAETGLTPTALAKRCGLASSTLTRSMNDPEHPFHLSRRTLEKIAAETGIPFQTSQDHGFHEGAQPKLDVMGMLQRETKNEVTDDANTIKIAVVGNLVQVAATVDKSGVRELIRRLGLAEQMMGDD